MGLGQAHLAPSRTRSRTTPGLATEPRRWLSVPTCSTTRADSLVPIGSPTLTLAADVPAGSAPTSFQVTTSGATNYTIPMGTILNVGGAVYGNPLSPNTGDFYVAANTVIGPGSTPTSVPVTSLVASLDTPIAVINVGNTFSADTLASAVSTNVYATNSCAPSIGGSATLNAGSSNAFYYAC